MFKQNYAYLCDQARKSFFCIKQKLKNIGTLPPDTMFYIFDTLLKPILTYGSDVWGISKIGRSSLDSFFLKFVKNTLSVKISTSNLMILGESGQIPPSIHCLYSCITFLNRIHHMDECTYVKQVYNELNRLHECGFHTWCSQAWELVNKYKLTQDSDNCKFKLKAKAAIRNDFKKTWLKEIKNTMKNPITRTYALFKKNYGTESYLSKVKNQKYRQALTRLRTSSRALRIESGRHEHIVPSLENRLCNLCRVPETEIHFLISCPLYETQRKVLYEKIGFHDDTIRNFSPIDQFVCILTMNDRRHLEEIAKFVYIGFEKHKLMIL